MVTALRVAVQRSVANAGRGEQSGNSKSGGGMGFKSGIETRSTIPAGWGRLGPAGIFAYINAFLGRDRGWNLIQCPEMCLGDGVAVKKM
jgi:hypothetical protein